MPRWRDAELLDDGTGFDRCVKRSIDIVFGAALLILALPLMLVSAVGASIALRSWPFFTQERVGRGGKVFTVAKIRTLPTGTPRYCPKNELDVRHVPRFTRWLRDTHLDELPQLLLVITGAMSLVGPRPEMPMLHEAMVPSVARARTSVRPGCTGLWQISIAAPGLIHDAPHYDSFYVRHRSIRLDVWVLARTFAVMALGAPQIDLQALPAWAGASTSPQLASIGPPADL